MEGGGSEGMDPGIHVFLNWAESAGLGDISSPEADLKCEVTVEFFTFSLENLGFNE